MSLYVILGEQDVIYNLILAVFEGKLEKTRELINSVGLSDTQEVSEGYDLLCMALSKKHLEIAKLLLAEGSKVASKNTDQHDTPLHLAIENGDLEIVEMILNKGANIDAKNFLSKTPLHSAIENDKTEFVELLLQHKADVNSNDMVGRSPLHEACRLGRLQIVERLLHYGADVNCLIPEKWSKGCSPLHFAVEGGNKEIVTLLLNRNAKVDVKGRGNVTPLHIAAVKGYESIAEDLLNHGACINSVTLDKGYTPLHFATKAKKINVIKLLLEHGAKVDTLSTDGETILHLAVGTGCLEIVKDVLKYHPDINNKSNRSCLKIAVDSYGKEIVEALLEYGFKVNTEDTNNPALLHTAVEKGLIKIVEYILKYGPVNTLINSKSVRDFTPLHSAVRFKQEEVAKLLISYGADINASGEYGRTPIFYATENADLKITELLLSNNANVKDDFELLNNAVKKKCIEIVETLLKHGADINDSDEYGRTPLYYATENADLQIAKLLLTNNANVKDDSELLNVAVMKNSKELVETLLQHGADINAGDVYGRTPILHAVKNADLEMVKFVLTNGANVKNNPELLIVAVLTECLGIVNALLQHGANINGSNEYGVTALHCTVRHFIRIRTKKGSEDIKREIVRLLLSNGANVNAQTKNGITTLHIAVQSSYAKIVEVLLEYNANVNSVVDCDFSPLHISVLTGNKKITMMLLNKGANVNAKRANGTTPLLIAVQEGYEEIAKLLLKFGANVDSKTEKDTMPLCFGSVKTMQKFGIDTNARDEHGRTALYIASEKGQKEIVETLLEYGTDINARDVHGRTALYIASEKGHKEIVEMLLENGTDINSRDEHGRTALTIASEEGCKEIVETLLKYGADINSIDENGKTALFIASECGLKEIVKTLLEYGADINISTSIVSLFVLENDTDYNQPLYSEIIGDLKRQIFKMKAANLYLCEDLLQSVKGDEMSDFQEECKREITRMSIDKIHNSNISLYDVLVRVSSSVAMLMKNEIVVEVMKSGDYEKQFPLYAGMIKNNFRKGLKRKELLEEVNKICHFFFPESLDDCTDKIFSYLSDADLKILTDACRPLRICCHNINDVMINSNIS